jgi:hypothetical protein
MADPWGGSWGTSWGVSWSSETAGVPPALAPGYPPNFDRRITEDQWLMQFIKDLVTSGRLER